MYIDYSFAISLACRLVVGGVPKTLSEGKCVVFDDSFQHEAFNDCDIASPPRVVLVIDFWHPDFTDDEVCLQF